MLVSKLCNNAPRTSPPGPAFVLEAPMRNYFAALLPSLLPVLSLVSNGQRRRPNDYDSSPNSQIQICYETGCRFVIRAAKLKFVAEYKTRVYLAQKCLNLQHCFAARQVGYKSGNTRNYNATMLRNKLKKNVFCITGPRVLQILQTVSLFVLETHAYAKFEPKSFN